jgi:hypothetical protein
MDPALIDHMADVLETATRRYIATVLGEYEAFTGAKNKGISDTVKDTANRSKRILLRQITGVEVESARPE